VSPPPPEAGRASPWPKPAPRAAGIALGAVLLVALGLRLGYLLEQRRDLLFEHPGFDEEEYVTRAWQLAQGWAEPREPYWQPPGITYVLAACFRVAGRRLLAPRLLQVGISVACCALLYLLARRRFSARIALAAAALLAVNGVFIHAGGTLLPSVWIAFIDLGALVLLTDARDRACWARALGGGLALGVSAVFRPTILVFVPVAALWLWPGARGRRRVLILAALGVGVVLPVGPVTLHNHRLSREWVLVSTNGGLNFYLGNNEHADETLAIRPGRRWEELMAEPRRAGIKAKGAQSRYFYRKALADVVRHPGAALARLLRKGYLFVNGHEIPRDDDLYAERAQSVVLGATVVRGPPPLPGALVMALALAGAVALWPARGRLGLFYGYLLAQGATVVAFFVTSRYRVPALPLLGLFALGGAARLGELARRATWAGRGALAVGLAGLVVALSLPLRETRASYRGERDFYRGLVCLRRLHDRARAVEYFRRAADEAPGDPRPLFELGNTLAELHRDDEAAAAWARAAAADPWDVRAGRSAAAVFARAGRLAEARRVLRLNVDARARDEATYAFEYFSLGTLAAREARYPEALAAFRDAARRDPRFFAERALQYAATERALCGDAELWFELGRIPWLRGDRVTAVRLWRAARDRMTAEVQRRIAELLDGAGDTVTAGEFVAPGPRGAR
jgi:4-amino-4-deoxy-L-arabinose transferase-like glycosyltransferase